MNFVEQLREKAPDEYRRESFRAWCTAEILQPIGSDEETLSGHLVVTNKAAYIVTEDQDGDVDLIHRMPPHNLRVFTPPNRNTQIMMFWIPDDSLAFVNALPQFMTLMRYMDGPRSRTIEVSAETRRTTLPYLRSLGPGVLVG